MHNLREVLAKNGNPCSRNFLGLFLFYVKIKTTYPGVQPPIWTLALGPKPGLQDPYRGSRLKLGGFDHLDIMPYSLMNLRGGNLVQRGSIWSRLVVIQRQRNFLNRKFFHLENGKKLKNLQESKNVPALAGPQVWMIFLINLRYFTKHIQNLDTTFWFKWRNCNFRNFDPKNQGQNF